MLLQIDEGPNRNPRYTLAARLQGPAAEQKPDDKNPEGKDDPGAAKPINVIYVADCHLIAAAFVRIRAQPDQMFRWRFENVTFALNVIDALSSDDAYVDIRKRKTKYEHAAGDRNPE